jgi:hypothetical protein
MQMRCGGPSDCHCCTNDAALTRIVGQIDVDPVTVVGGSARVGEKTSGMGTERGKRVLRRFKNFMRRDIYT